MGNEIGQFREWNYADQIEWFLLDYEAHAKLQHYVAELNHFYLATPALWQIDDSWDGFQWIDADNREQSIISYRRIDRKGKEVLILINFTPVVRNDYLLGVPTPGIYEEVFNSDSEAFGGSGVVNLGNLNTTGIPWNHLADSVQLRIPPLGMCVLRLKRKKTSDRRNQKSMPEQK